MSDDRFPFPAYPDGWFRIAYSEDLKPGDVQPLKYFGKDLVLFRTEAGDAALLDAFCSHLGTHLGHGSKVVGDCIECPFHAWRFDAQGQVALIPYAKKIPPRARVGRWHLREINGHIFAWHHGAGQAPSWEIPLVPEVESEQWTRLYRRTWRIRTRNQEMAENSVDTAHFRYLHGSTNLPPAKAWAEGPIFRSDAEPGMSTPRGGVQGCIQISAFGFGFTTVRFSGIVDTLNIVSATAIDDEYLDVHFNFTVKKSGNASIDRGVGKAFVAEVSRQLEQDIPVWEHKAFVQRPLICDGDGPIGLFRSWSRQFYSASEVAAE